MRSTLLLEEMEEPTVELAENKFGRLPIGKTRMYAIAFDLDTAQLQNEYPNASWQNAYGDIRKVLEPRGFTWQQGSVYFGGENIDAVQCVLAGASSKPNLSVVQWLCS
jgi:virulence-associated protein VapD